MIQVQKFRSLAKNTWKVFVLITGLAFLGLGFSLYQSWQQQLNAERESLVQEANMASVLVEDALLDASKLLDIASESLEAALSDGSLTKLQAHEILRSSVDRFSLYNQGDLSGLLFYIDRNGRIYAQNSDYPTPDYDVSDRYYFQVLSQNPALPRAIGNLVIGRTNKRVIFHLAKPILDRNHKFNGVVLQQINANALAKSLEQIKDLRDQRIITHLSNGLVAFTYPVPKLEDLNRSYALAIEKVIGDQKLWRGTLEMAAPDDHSQARIMVGFTRSPIFGLTTSVSVSLNTIWLAFLKSNLDLLIYAILSGIAVTILFCKFYRQTTALSRSTLESLQDPLTCICNRRALDEELPRHWADSKRQQQPISALFIDIDHFKAINDTYGHEAGDVVLKTVAQTITSQLQRPLDFCCRWGGEEFVAILPNTSQPGASIIAHHIMDAIRHLEFMQEARRALKITVSIGIASLIVNDANFDDDLIGMADKAMLSAKENGRNRVEVFKQTL